MEFQEGISLKGKTTMRIGGTAQYYCEPESKDDIEKAIKFAEENDFPLIIEAVVMRIKSDDVNIDGNKVTVKSGKPLASLVNELAEVGLDLSVLTGIPGSVGGAIFGNAGQGPQGKWIDSFTESVTAFVDGDWKTYDNSGCNFSYRESEFKDQLPTPHSLLPIIWEVTLSVPSGDPEKIKTEVDNLLKKRLETQPHRKTSGSCFKAAGDTPAWKLIDKKGLRGAKIGDMQISEKHANFLLNTGDASFEDAKKTVEKIQNEVPEELEVEMRFVNEDGSVEF